MLLATFFVILSAAILAVLVVTADADNSIGQVGGAAAANVMGGRDGAASLAARAQRAIDAYPAYDRFDWVECAAEGDTVILRGAVVEPWRVAEYAAFVRGLSGVRAVRNELRVVAGDERDRRLRLAAASALESAAAPRSVHVLVEDGTVTLKGFVGTEIERALLVERVGAAVAPVAVRSQVRPLGAFASLSLLSQ